MSEERSLMPERIKLFQADDMDESADYYHSRLYRAQQSQIAELQQKVERLEKTSEIKRQLEAQNQGEINDYEVQVMQLQQKLEIAESLVDFEMQTELEDRYKKIEVK